MNPFTTTCDVYRPFGDATPTATGVPCRLVPELQTLAGLQWTHYIDLPDGTDVRDGCTRSEGLNAIAFADGDEVRIGGTRYAVVWVEGHNRDTAQPFRRAYLFRHEVTWPDV